MYEALIVHVCLTGLSWTLDRHMLLKSYCYKHENRSLYIEYLLS